MSESDLRKDVQELKSLLATATRDNTIKLLNQEKQRLEALLQHVQSTTVPKKVSTTVKRPLVTLKNYAWDQSDKFIKIYLTNLKGVQNLQSDQLALSSDNEQQPVFTISNLNGKDYKFLTPKLVNLIEKVTIKQKEDMVLLMYRKATPGEKWDCLTEKEKESKEEKALKSPSPSNNEADPSASIMTMMKKMYDEGDDDMKRTISKAWTESRDKQAGGMGGMPGMGGMGGMGGF